MVVHCDRSLIQWGWGGNDTANPTIVTYPTAFLSFGHPIVSTYQGTLTAFTSASIRSTISTSFSFTAFLSLSGTSPEVTDVAENILFYYIAIGW